MRYPQNNPYRQFSDLSGLWDFRFDPTDQGLAQNWGAGFAQGWHAQPPEMFSEEYQVEFLRQTLEVLERLPFVMGAHVWNLCDFKTSQAVNRAGAINYKGVFTRERRPKMAAHFLRVRWGEE